MKRARVKLLSLAAATAGVLGGPVSPASSGSYVVSACSPASSPGLWAQTNTFASGFTTGNQCGGPAIGRTDGSHQGALYAEDVLNSPVNIPDGSRAGWTFNAPPATTITAISYYRNLHAYNDEDLLAGLFQADGSPLEQCKIPWPFVAGSSIHCDKLNNQAPVTFSGLNTSSLFLGVMCRIVTNAIACIGGGAPIHAATADLYSARVTLSEGSLPTIGNIGGPLWGGGLVSGVAAVTFTATDPSGIQAQLVRGDTGKTLVSVSQACDFTLAAPCPQQPAGALNVDTTRVPDGAHTFGLVVSDAAGNDEVATSPSVVVDNNGPPPPVLSATAQGFGSRVIVLSWRNPSSAPAPITGAIAQLCQATCAAATSVGASGAAKLTAPGPGRYDVRLWLLDSLGQGGPRNAAHAAVTIPAATGASGSRGRSRIAAVVTGRGLRVSGTIMRSGRVRVSWRSKLGGRTVGSGTRVVAIHAHRIALTFTLGTRARRGTTRVAVRSRGRIIAQARARRG